MIEEILEVLQKNESHHLSVYDATKSKKTRLVGEMNLPAILEQYSSLEDFIRSFNDKGFKEIQLETRRRNGRNAFRAVEHFWFISFNKNESLPTTQHIQEIEKPTIENVNYLARGVGKKMNADQYFNLLHKVKKLERLEAEFPRERKILVDEKNKAKAKYKRLKKEFKKLNSAYEKETEKSFLENPAVQQLAGGVKELLPMAMDFISKKSGALAGGETDSLSNLSEIKKSFYNQVLNQPSATDAFISDLHKIAFSLMENKEFKTQIEQLLNNTKSA